MSNLAVEAEELGRRYGRRWALAGLSLRIHAGSLVMLAGRNGSGKSTLLRVLATAIRPDLGSARVFGFDLVREREDIRRNVALLSHYSYLYEALTPRENLEVVASHLRIGRDRIAPLLQRVSLDARANDTVSTFSAGMRKRLSFARVLLQSPKLAMLDEPYGQLDPEGFKLVDEVVGELKAAGTTVIMATHQVERVARMADQTITLEAGRIP